MVVSTPAGIRYPVRERSARKPVKNARPATRMSTVQRSWIRSGTIFGSSRIRPSAISRKAGRNERWLAAMDPPSMVVRHFPGAHGDGDVVFLPRGGAGVQAAVGAVRIVCLVQVDDVA